MLLYIVRHAYAGQHGDPRYPDDSLRPVTKRGRKQFARAVKKLAKRGFAPRSIATSPFVRCRQTADVICERLVAPPEVIELPALEPGSRLDALVEWSNGQGVDELAWVGHAPDVEVLAASLVGAAKAASISPRAQWPRSASKARSPSEGACCSGWQRRSCWGADARRDCDPTGGARRSALACVENGY